MIIFWTLSYKFLKFLHFMLSFPLFFWIYLNRSSDIFLGIKSCYFSAKNNWFNININTIVIQSLLIFCRLRRGGKDIRWNKSQIVRQFVRKIFRFRRCRKTLNCRYLRTKFPQPFCRPSRRAHGLQEIHRHMIIKYLKNEKIDIWSKNSKIWAIFKTFVRQKG